MDVEFGTEIDSGRDAPQNVPLPRLSDPDLFARIDAYTIGPADADLSFARRLARENDWADRYAADAIGEYKRFIYLICISAGPLTPSRDVDEVWHLHLTYSRDYWERFCRETLGRDLHHTPTEGGPVEAGKFRQLYDDTLRAYEAEFGVRAPLPFWPDAERRFSEATDPVKVSRDRYFVIPRRYWAFLAAACAALFLAGCNLGKLLQVEFLSVLFFLSFVLMAITFVRAVAPHKVTKGGGADGSGCGGGKGDGGCGGGGCGGCGG